MLIGFALRHSVRVEWALGERQSWDLRSCDVERTHCPRASLSRTCGADYGIPTPLRTCRYLDCAHSWTEAAECMCHSDLRTARLIHTISRYPEHL
ncbi:uncharacterized protein N7529_009891 [Penicillium soppii]|uniref:uncharacterized protein n=1 Tax=Penicillium soppii TaxID=69789 RepID=UPI0025477FB0|nr:uncharacterized protein N7529_009891 [Penicillium soppii]KAJ5855947.1 hypothetical protein N7529_009891 [Penicillium soppii]